MVAMAMSLSDRLSLAGLGTTGSSISNLDILDMVPFWIEKIKKIITNNNMNRNGIKKERTLKANGCRTFPWTVVDSRMTAVSGPYWYQFTLRFWLFSSFRLRLSGNTWRRTHGSGLFLLKTTGTHGSLLEYYDYRRSHLEIWLKNDQDTEMNNKRWTTNVEQQTLHNKCCSTADSFIYST